MLHAMCFKCVTAEESNDESEDRATREVGPWHEFSGVPRKLKTQPPGRAQNSKLSPLAEPKTQNSVSWPSQKLKTQSSELAQNSKLGTNTHMARNIRLCEGDIYCSLYNPRTRTAALAPSSTSIVEVMPAAGEENFAPQGLVRGRGPLGKYEGGSALRPSPKLKTQFFGQPQNSKLSPLRGPETQNSKLEPGA